MTKIAKASSWIALALLPVVVMLLGRHFELVYITGLAALPLALFLAADHWPARKPLRWLALALNGLVALVMVPAFAYMLSKVPAPPGIVAVLPVLAAAHVLAIAPVLNVVALLVWRRKPAVLPASA